MSKKIRIPGVSFSLSRALGIDKVKRQIARETGIPTTKSGLEKKIGRTIINAVFGRKTR
ncbi:MAG: hypothetical protein IAB75_00035 [Bacteroidetes bacterium]|uniref:Uncharacterized protein n=1 Tax=Candidatus Cryptobacteroides avicola TaxID=2840757 RepID=A0A940IHA4_9BACT|nr:hypothetical protein [Candidatus Cryptobacteroides avicola]